jgi:uncharacterized protein
MLIELKITNFRSIKDEATLSLIAESGQSNSDNITEILFPNESSLRLLKSAVIYGSNASGKSNLIRGVFALNSFVLNSSDLKVEEPIQYYEPFLFDEESKTRPVKFELLFAINEADIYIKYRYTIEFLSASILSEQLDYYPKGMIHNLFKREVTEENPFHIGRLSKDLGYKEFPIFSNQLVLSKFGKDIPHEILSKVYLYFNTFEVWNVVDTVKIERLKETIIRDMSGSKNEKLLKKLIKLLKIADTQIENITVKESSEADFKFPKDFPAELKKRVIQTNRTQIFAEHSVYENDILTSTASIPFREESAGTNALLAIGGLILKKLESGGAIFIDELNNSLHPKLTRFLVRLFNNPIANPKNTQLIFATHEVTLLDKAIFRKDQIWITDKDKTGNTDLYSIKENCNVRDDIPFEQWYRNGKFGGQPKIKEVEFIFGDE